MQRRRDGAALPAPPPQGESDEARLRFRRILSHFPTGMVAITAYDEEPVGMAIGSFSSISLDPLLVGFFVARQSTTWPRIERARQFAANVLALPHEGLCRRFAVRGAERFDGVNWRPGRSGAPLISGALAWVEASVVDVIGCGDHYLVVGEVLELEAGEEQAPLIAFRSEFIGPGAPVGR